jgi:hypothetical protein
MFELIKSCRLDKNLVDLILQNLSLLSKNSKKFFPPLDVSSLDWVRSVCVKCVWVSRIDCFRRWWADGHKKRQKTATEALVIRYGLILVVSPTEVPHHHKEGDWSTPPSLYIVSVWGWLLCYEHGEAQEQVAASNTGGGLEVMLVNHRTSDKGHHETSPSTGFPLVFLCLHKYFLFLHMFLFVKTFLPSYTYCK